MSMERRYGFVSQGCRGWRLFRNEEFQEDDVWDVIEESKEVNKNVGTHKDSASVLLRPVPSAARMIPGARAPTQERKVMMQQHSAPVNIPDWSKIYGKSFRSSSSNGSCIEHDGLDDDDDDVDRKGCAGGRNGADTDGEDYDDDDHEDGDDHEGGGRLPPHEWLAEKLARNQISSFSVCEGAGRTLKGRDLSRVRNDVLIKTGFI